MIGYENKIMAQTVPKIASMQNSWCVTHPPPSYMSSISSHINLNQQQPQNLNDYSVSTADTSAADLDNFDLSLLLPQPAAEPPTSSEDGLVPTTEVLEHQQDILSQLTNYNNGSNCYTGADTLDTLDLTQLLSLYDDYCNSEVAAGEYQNMLKTSSDTTSVTTTATIQIKEEVDDITTTRSPSTFISTSSSPQSPPEVTYNVNCTWFVQDQPTSVVSSLECTKPQSSSVLLRSLLESNVKEELAVQSTTSDDDVETKPIMQSTDSIKASSHKLLIEMLKGSTEDRTIEDDTSTTPSVGSTSLISTASSSSTAVSDLAELLLYSPDQGVPTDNDEKSNSQKDSRLWEVVEQQQQWSHQNSKNSTHDMTVPSLSPQQNGELDQVLFDDAAALVDGLLFGGDNVFKEQDGSMSPLNKDNKDDVRLEAQMDMWKSLLLQQEQQEDDHRQKRNTTSVDRQQQPPLKRQRVDNEHDIMLTTSLSSLGSISPASSTSSTLTMTMLDKNDNVISTDCDKDEDDEFYVRTAATSPSSSSTRSPGSVSGSSGTSTQHHHHHIHLWQFLKELLQQYDDQDGLQSSAEDGKQTPSTIIRWLDRPKGVFKIEDSVAVAKLWGRRKNRPAMNYDKLSRSIRQYYKKGIMKKTERSQRLVYQFCHPYSGSPSTVCSNSTTTNVVAVEMSP